MQIKLSESQAAFIRSVLRSYLVELKHQLIFDDKSLTDDKRSLLNKEVDDTLKALSFL